MTDSPTRRKRYGSGICWDYMDQGICPCDTLATFPEWHPQLVISTTATTSSTSSSKGTIASMPKKIPEWIEILTYLNFVMGDPNNFAVLTQGNIYQDREEVKSLGATYSPGMKQWIVVQGQDLAPFAKWKPVIHHRDANELVFHNMNMDITTAVRQLQRCGIKPSHIHILGDDAQELNILRNCLAKMVQKNENHASRMSRETEHVAGGIAKKRRLEFNEHGRDKNGSSGSMRPQFSSPESLQRFVTSKQNQQVEAGMGMRLNGTESSPNLGVEQDELSTLLLDAKSALVKCNSSGGGISTEQKQFNESIYNVMEALTTKVINHRHHEVDQTSTTNASSVNLTAPSPERNQKQNLVTPMQKAG